MEFIDRLERRGLSVWRRDNGHYAIAAPDGDTVYMSSTPNNHRAILKTISLLRKHGFEYKEKP